MGIFSIFTRAWTWFTKNFVNHIQSSAHVAFIITETIKTLLANPITGFLENVADTITGTQIPTDIANAINAVIPKIIAVELGIQGLPANPTAADIAKFEADILSIFNISSNNSKLYTELAAQIYGIIQTSVNSGKTSFADWVIDIENIYLAYKADLAANAQPTPAASPDVSTAS